MRIEELINYFRFDYPQPRGTKPFSVTTELAVCPWNTRHKLALIGLQGREIPEGDEAPRNLVFLIDVSGSMMPADKLPLVRTAMRMLTEVLTERDRVAIVVMPARSGLVSRPRLAIRRQPFIGRLPSFRLAARPMEATVSSWPIALRGNISSRAASIVSCSRPTVISTWA